MINFLSINSEREELERHFIFYDTLCAHRICLMLKKIFFLYLGLTAGVLLRLVPKDNWAANSGLKWRSTGKAGVVVVAVEHEDECDSADEEKPLRC